jgi:hypothetical protein
MKRLLIALILIWIAAIGCKKEEQEISDEQAIMELISESPLFDISNHYEGGATSDSGDTSYYVMGDSIVPILWGREILEQPDPTISISIVGDSAYVIYEGYNRGNLDILTWDPDSGWILYKKPLSETYQIHAVFRKTGKDTDPNRGWELTHISGAKGISDSVNTVRIDSIRISSTSYPDTVLRDPLMLFSVDSILTFSQGEPVYLTLYTNDGTARAFLHVFAIFPRHIRIPFTNMGERIYQNPNPWYTQIIPAVRLAVFDLMQYETLHDSEYPYDFCGWLFPYRVVSSR